MSISVRHDNDEEDPLLCLEPKQFCGIDIYYDGYKLHDFDVLLSNNHQRMSQYFFFQFHALLNLDLGWSMLFLFKFYLHKSINHIFLVYKQNEKV